MKAASVDVNVRQMWNKVVSYQKAEQDPVINDGLKIKGKRETTFQTRKLVLKILSQE